jgi:hypothetical protein
VLTVLELVLGRFPSDPSILLIFTQHALTATTTAATATDPAAAANGNKSNSSYGQQLEQLVLQVLETHEGPCATVKADEEMSKQLHMLLYNHGVLQFEGKRFDVAVKFFTASLDFAQVRHSTCLDYCEGAVLCCAVRSQRSAVQGIPCCRQLPAYVAGTYKGSRLNAPRSGCKMQRL